MRRVAVNFISKRQISRAMSKMNSCGLGNISNPEILTQLRDKYLVRGRDRPEKVERGQVADDLKGLRYGLLLVLVDCDPSTWLC